MRFKMLLPAVLSIFCSSFLSAQPPQPERPNQPIYRVTVVERTVRAVNYQYRSGPTEIDFRGTVLLPEAKGDATVESKAGRTEIDAHFERIAAPGRFGAEYLTYVLWAITPEGHPKNLGEVLANGSDKAHLHVTTDLQNFGLIVTAEPYSAVRLPSDVVTLENQVRPDTIGSTEPVQVRYELMPRGTYTYNVPADLKALERGPKVSMSEYESLVELYQAQNAVQIAASQGADDYAPEVMGKARTQLEEARRLQAHKSDRSMVVTAARAAAQTAEDARAVSTKRKQEKDLALAKDQVVQEQQLRAAAEANAQRAEAEARAARQTLDAERAARQAAEMRAEADNVAAAARAQVAAAAPAPPPPSAERQSADRMDTRRDSPEKTALRAALLQQLNGTLEARDTPRGLVVTVPNSGFRGGALSPSVSASLARVASVVSAHPGLTVEVEGHTDGSSSGAESEASQRAMTVRGALLSDGLAAQSVTARGMGNSRPIASTSNAAGREQNRRVEITISGDSIGSLPSWDRTYSVKPAQ